MRGVVTEIGQNLSASAPDNDHFRTAATSTCVLVGDAMNSSSRTSSVVSSSKSCAASQSAGSIEAKAPPVSVRSARSRSVTVMVTDRHSRRLATGVGCCHRSLSS